MAINDRTTSRSYAKPNAANLLTEDVERLREALDSIDTDVAAVLVDLLTKAATASPAFTGTPTAPTPATDTDTTQIATAAFVKAQTSTSNPAANGTPAAGVSSRFARADHIHPTDTSRAPLASPTFTGAPEAPTPAADTNTTQLATTGFVVGQGYTKQTRQIFSGTGLTGGGDLTANRTIAADIATQAEAEAGTNSAKLMTPQRTAQAIEAMSAGGAADVQEFTSSGTWTKPAGVTVVLVEVIGGGGGGGSGARYATTSQRNGGGGGASGTYLYRYFDAVDLTSTVSVTVGAGGNGGSAATTDTTNGSPGSSGGQSAFGSYVNSGSAGFGGSGSNSTVLGGTISFRGVLGTTAEGGGGSNVSVTGSFLSGGGGAGVAKNANNTFSQFGERGGISFWLSASANGATGNGANATANEGGGGGGGNYVTATAGVSGGNGAFPGGGGGGGGPSDNGFNSGAGGNGGSGLVRVTSW